MKNRGGKLQMLLDLIQTDLSKVPQEEQRELIIKAAEITNQDIFIMSTRALAFLEITRKNPSAWNAWDALLEIKEDVLFVLNWILDHKKGVCNYHLPANLRWSPDTKIVEETHTYPKPRRTEIMLVDFGARSDDKSSTKEIRIESLVVLRSLDGVKWERLKRCPCGKIFVQLTARNKIYHSMKCARRHAAKRSDERKRKEGK